MKIGGHIFTGTMVLFRLFLCDVKSRQIGPMKNSITTKEKLLQLQWIPNKPKKEHRGSVLRQIYQFLVLCDNYVLNIVHELLLLSCVHMV